MKTFFTHQSDIYEDTRDLRGYALHWEMRVGKTLPIIRTAGWQYERGNIDFVILTAPGALPLKWSREDVPEDRPDDILFEWESKKANQVGYKKRLEEFINGDAKGLRWLFINSESVDLANVKKLIKQILRKYKVFLINDESHVFKNGKSKRTKAMMTTSENCAFVRNLTGTPSTKGPFDLWSQFYMIDPSILGYSFAKHKQRYGIFKKMEFNGQRPFEMLVAYKDLERLHDKIAPYSHRLLESDVRDVPEVIQDTIIFEMDGEQRRVFQEFKQEMMVQIESGEIISSSHAIVMLVRLQQISRGFVGDGDTVYPITEGKAPASIKALLNAVYSINGKVIIWCRFIPDVDMVIKYLTEAGYKCIRFDGSVDKRDRPQALKDFNDYDDIKFMVGTPATGGLGYDMSIAETTINYSHGYRYDHRKQSIARVKGPNQKAKSLLLLDVVGIDTPDKRILQILDRDESNAAILTGDVLRGLIN